MVCLPENFSSVILWFEIMCCFLLRAGSGQKAEKTVRIGGVFEYEYTGQEMAFVYAVDKINRRRDLLPHIKLVSDIQQAQSGNSFDVSKKVCRQTKEGVAAVFGPMSELSAAHVQSICDNLEIPHVETRWDFNDNKDAFSINLYPDYDVLGRAFIDFIDKFQWTSFTILYETNEGLIRLQSLLKAPAGKDLQISVRRLEPSVDDDGGPDYRPTLKEIRNRGESRIILDCDYSNLYDILHDALTINMTTQYYHYMLTTLDIGLVNLNAFSHNGVNITSYRLIDPKRAQIVDITNDWLYEYRLNGRSPLEDGLQGFKTETALMYDAVHLFARALDDLSRAQELKTASLSCTRNNQWEEGLSLINYMKMTKLEGLTGSIEFDNTGKRSRFALELIELSLAPDTRGKLLKIGQWDPVEGLNITKDYSQVQSELADLLKNKTLRITTILEDPYMMLKDDPNKELIGNQRYEGYCMDLLKEISRILKFDYAIHLVKDGQYGAPAGPKQEWSGMVRELMDEEADLAVASLTISFLREQVIDFTKPFMNLGISILFKRPERTNPSLFAFLSPLSFEIWIYVLAAYLVVSFMLFVLARFTPYEWSNPHPCNPDSDMMENQFTLLNSLWFTIGSLMQQGSEIAPKAVSTRIVSGIWWFFTLIMISSYTANLAAFLTVERMTSPIENADDLSKQTQIKYGTVYGGSTMSFFKTSKIPVYERMWNFMESERTSDKTKNVFVNSTKEGIERVRNGDYAYLLESTMNEYIVQRNCELMQVGGLLDSKGYGIGTPRGSPFRDLLSDAILKLQEDQILQMLYNKWWKEKGGAGQCNEEEGKKDANALAITHVGGVFVVLVAGLILSLVVALLEFVWKANKNAAKHERQQSICNEMLQELRFAMQCFGSSKRPVKTFGSKNASSSMLGDRNGMTPMMPIGFERIDPGYPIDQGYPMHNHTVPRKDMYT